jgi:hypothetical protein
VVPLLPRFARRPLRVARAFRRARTRFRCLTPENECSTNNRPLGLNPAQLADYWRPQQPVKRTLLVAGISFRCDETAQTRIHSTAATTRQATNTINSHAAPAWCLWPGASISDARSFRCAVRTAVGWMGVPAASSSVPSGAAAGSGQSLLSPVRPESISSRNCDAVLPRRWTCWLLCMRYQRCFLIKVAPHCRALRRAPYGGACFLRLLHRQLLCLGLHAGVALTNSAHQSTSSVLRTRSCTQGSGTHESVRCSYRGAVRRYRAPPKGSGISGRGQFLSVRGHTQADSLLRTPCFSFQDTNHVI